MQNVKVGRYIPVRAGALPRFMQRFEEAYTKIGKVDEIIAAATAHHLLLWLHPLLDGNGRIARLRPSATRRDALETGGIWSIAQELARNEAQYKSRLLACDAPQRNELGGRGHLSEEALADVV